MIRNPEDFKNPSLFKTSWPIEDALRKVKYDEALKLSREAYANGGAIHITSAGVWSARWPNTHIQSYEKIGYHAGTCHFLQGLLEGPAPIWIFPDAGEGVKIKEAGIAGKVDIDDATHAVQLAKVRDALFTAGFQLLPKSDVFVSPVMYIDGKNVEIRFANNTFQAELTCPIGDKYLVAYSLRCDGKNLISDDITHQGAWRLVSCMLAHSAVQ